MKVSLERVHQDAVLPEWSSLHSHSPSSSYNMWPMRQQSHSKRFFNPPKSLKGHDSEATFRLDIAPINVKVDVDYFNKQKSHSSMAFCSTSKVKYMPLHGFSQDSLAQFKWSDPHSNIFPSISRPNSRPVILHGKRYTILAVEGDRSQSDTFFNNKEEDKCSQKTERSSEQRRRFNEVERHKSSTRMYKDNGETSQCRIQRDYCLSGRRMMLKSSKESMDERVNRLRPILNLQNIIKREDEHIRDNLAQETIDQADHVSRPFEIMHTTVIPTKESFISEQRLSKEEIELSARSCSLSEAIKSAFNDRRTVQNNEDAYKNAKEYLQELIQDYLKEIQERNDEVKNYECINFDEVWKLLFPKEEDFDGAEEVENMFKERFGEDMSREVSLNTFLSIMFDDEDNELAKGLWSKTLSSLNVVSFDMALYLKIALLVQIFKQEDQSMVVIHAKLHFWTKLFSILFSVNGKMVMDTDSFLKVLVNIILTKIKSDKDSETFVEGKVKSFFEENLHTNQEDQNTVTLTMIHLLETMLWLFSTHFNPSFFSFTLDDIASLLSSQTEHFTKRPC